ncbi:hypothetical protein [Methylobacterium sp. A54F]
MGLFVKIGAASAVIAAGLSGALISTGSEPASAAAAPAPAVAAPMPAACAPAAWPYGGAGCAPRPVRVIALTETAPAVAQAARPALRPVSSPAPKAAR